MDQTNNRVLIFNISSFQFQLGPEFEQGKAVLGKVFHDRNGNGVQDSSPVIASEAASLRGSGPDEAEAISGIASSSTQNRGGLLAMTSQGTPSVPPRNDVVYEKGIEGVKVVSDTGIYAITDEDGKYHFPYIETGQHILKIDTSTLPEGSQITTESPRKIVVTKGILTKVSFGVMLPETLKPQDIIANPEGMKQSQSGIASAPSGVLPRNDLPLLKVSISQDPSALNPKLGVEAKQEKDKIIFTLQCNYFLFIAESRLVLYDQNYKQMKVIPLPNPIPLYYELPLKDLPEEESFYYQLIVRDHNGKEDRTGLGRIELGRLS